MMEAQEAVHSDFQDFTQIEATFGVTELQAKLLLDFMVLIVWHPIRYWRQG